MKIRGGIASTTHLDYHGQRMAKSALDQFAGQIKDRYIPLLIEHDFDRQIGVNLSARVVRLEDGEHALLIVSGIFEDDSEAAAFRSGEANAVWKRYESTLDDVETRVPTLLSMAADWPSPEDAEYPQTIAGQLELHLDSTSVAPDRSVGLIKQRIATIRDLEINVYPKDHEPAHFHVRSRQRNMDARFRIETLEFINEKRGKIKPKEIRQVQDFFEKNPAMYAQLKQEYERLK
jgi:Domain of unknown function (DUF4160)